MSTKSELTTQGRLEECFEILQPVFEYLARPTTVRVRLKSEGEEVVTSEETRVLIRLLEGDYIELYVNNEGKWFTSTEKERGVSVIDASPILGINITLFKKVVANCVHLTLQATARYSTIHQLTLEAYQRAKILEHQL